jgi:hypothetical protein
MKISTIEGTIHEVQNELLVHSQLLKNMMDEETDDEQVFPLPNITDELFIEIMRFSHIFHEKPVQIDLPVHSGDFSKLVPNEYLGLIEHWFHKEPHAKYMKRILKAADYMAMDNLIHVCHAKMQTTIFDRNPVEVLRMYGVEDAEQKVEKLLNEMDEMYPRFSNEIRKLT